MQPQPVDVGLTPYAIFLVLLIAEDEASLRAASALLNDMHALVRAVEAKPDVLLDVALQPGESD